jgi:hypothetical protein
MRTSNSYQEWTSLFARLGVSDTAFDERGCMALAIDGRYRVDCQLCSGGLVLLGTIGQVPPAVALREMVFTRVLHQVSAYARNRQEIPILNEGGHALLLQRRLEDSMPFELFEAAIEAFVDALLAWKQWFREAREAGHPSSASRPQAAQTN